MKLNKFIPIASITSVAAIVTPLVTSCANAQSFHYEFKFGETEFEPTIIRPESEGLKMSEATGIVLSEIANNKQILADELAYNQYSVDSPGADYYGVIYDICMGNIDPASGRISLSFTDTWLEEDEDTSEIKAFQKVTVDIQNMPMAVIYDNGWGILPLFSYIVLGHLIPFIGSDEIDQFVECLKNEKEWRINVRTIFYSPVVSDVTVNYLWSSNEDDLYQLAALLFNQRWWLTIPPENNIYLSETPLLPE